LQTCLSPPLAQEDRASNERLSGNLTGIRSKSNRRTLRKMMDALIGASAPALRQR